MIFSFWRKAQTTAAAGGRRVLLRNRHYVPPTKAWGLQQQQQQQQHGCGLATRKATTISAMKRSSAQSTLSLVQNLRPRSLRAATLIRPVQSGALSSSVYTHHWMESGKNSPSRGFCTGAAVVHLSGSKTLPSSEIATGSRHFCSILEFPRIRSSLYQLPSAPLVRSSLSSNATTISSTAVRTRRCLSSSNEKNSVKDNAESNSSPTTATTTDSPSATTTKNSTTSMNSEEVANPRITTRVRTRVRNMVRNTNLDDFLTLSGIVIVFGVMAVAPYASREMQKSNRTIDDIGITDDPVDDFPQLARVEWLELGQSTQNVLEDVLKDVVRSKALQEAAQQFVVQILQSDEVRMALNRLIKQLWTDLVTDEETVAQVIHLLQIAIQNDNVKRAAQKLVIDLVEDPEVKMSLITMVQRLGQAQDVQRATQGLLLHSAHWSLNDADLLEHSMAFATDVLGDDVVQQTAGEALRNTVGHAFRPAATVMMTATGITLILFGFVALGFARSTDQEVRVMEKAAMSLQANAAKGLTRILNWPFRKLYDVGQVIVRTLVYTPLQGLQSALEQLGQLPGMVGWAVFSGLKQGAIWIGKLVERGVQSVFQIVSNQLTHGRDVMATALRTVLQAVLSSVHRQWTRTKDQSTRAMARSEQCFLGFLVAVEEFIVNSWIYIRSQVFR